MAVLTPIAPTDTTLVATTLVDVPLPAAPDPAVTVDSGAPDGTITTATSDSVAVIDTNQAPIVSGPALVSTLADGASAVIDRAELLVHATDPDLGDTLDIQINDLPVGLVYNHVPGTTTVSTISYYGFSQIVTIPTVDTLTLDTSNAVFASLAQGEELDVVVNYGVTDGSATAAAQAIFQVTGINDAPLVSGPVTATATEGGAVLSVSGIATATDVDRGSVLTVVAAPPPAPETENFINAAGVAEGAAPPPPPILPFDATGLPAGVSFDATTNSFSIDPSDPAYRSLGAGQTQTVTVNYGVSDGFVAAAASTIFTVVGTNEAPVVSGPAETSASEGTGGIALGRTALLAHASDPDTGDKLDIVINEQDLPDGVVYNHTPGAVITNIVPAFSYYGFNIPGGVTVTTILPTDTLTLDTSNPAFELLAQGQTKDFVIAYGVTDGQVTTPTQAVFHLTGANDAPVVSGPVAGAATEGSGLVTVNGLANASDVDDGSILSVVALPLPPAGEVESIFNAAGVVERAAPPPPPILPLDLATLPAGVSFDAATNSFSIDPSDPAYRSLGVGQTQTVTVNYGVSDGFVATAASATFTVVGTNEAPVVSGPATLTVREDSALQAFSSGMLLAHASDADTSDVLQVADLESPLPAGVSQVDIAGGYVAIPDPTAYYGIRYEYTAPTHGLAIDTSNAAFQSLAEGETMDVSFTYSVSDGTVSTPTSAIITVVGTNDAPVVAASVNTAADEDSAQVTLNALGHASDIDHGAVLTVTGAPPSVAAAAGTEISGPYYGALRVVHGNSAASADDPGAVSTVSAAGTSYDFTALPAGVSFDAATNDFSLDPSNAAYQKLSAGQVQTVTVNYGVTDGMVTTAASAVFTVTGANDAPLVSGPLAFAANEDAAARIIDPLANASDVDQLDVLKAVSGPMPDGVQLTLIPGGYYQPDIAVTTFNPGDAAFQSLAQGEVETVTWNYEVTDGHVSTAAAATFTVTGANDAPVISVPVGAAMLEDAAPVTVDALAGATDVDHGALLSVVNVPALLPGGITYDATTHSFSIDPADAAFQALAQGEAHTYSIGYGVTDGIDTVQTSVNFTVIGANDAPVITGPVTASPKEDSGVITVNATGNATDVDAHQGVHATDVPNVLPVGVSFDAATDRFSFDSSNAAYQ